MLKKRKVTVAVEKHEQFNINEKILQNFQEDCRFVDILEDLYARKVFANMAISLGQTPFSLRLGGANVKNDLVIKPGTLYKLISSSDEKRHGHNLSVDTLNYLLQEVRNPAVLLKGSQPNSLVAVTGLKDSENRPIIVSIAMDRRHQHHMTNQITSAYGRNGFNSYLRRQVEQGNVIAINKNKANRMFRSAGLQLPIEETLISFDNSISYTLESVKDFFGNFPKRLEMYFPPGAAYYSDERSEEFNRLINKFNSVVSERQEIVEKLKFFDYAGEEIYDSMIWHKFQQDKDFLESNASVVLLENVLDDARNVVNRIEEKETGTKDEKTIDMEI